MARDPYNQRVRELFAAPQHAGDAGGAEVTVARGGMRIALGAAQAGGKLTRVRFRAFGCPHLVAALERFCAGSEGGPVRALQRYSVTATMEELEIPVEKTGRMLLVEDAVRALYERLAAESANLE